MSSAREQSSFRDPSGVVFTWDGVVYRQINPCYLETYRLLMDSGLYGQLSKDGLLVSHEETGEPGFSADGALVIRPRRLPFISYPYEWSFHQLKSAALCTLRIQRQAMDYGMMLKDASAFNIQFDRGRPLLIDTLSFEAYREGTPWIAYGQFCRHFIAPLLLMKYVDVRLGGLSALHIDGIPIDLASQLLRKKGGFFAKQHIHWHASSIQKHAQDGKAPAPAKPLSISRFQLTSMVESMIRGIEKLELGGPLQTEWGDYYDHTNYTDAAAQDKHAIVASFLEDIAPSFTVDLGANNGEFSRLAERHGFVLSLDIDHEALGRNFCQTAEKGENILPLFFDFANPTPAVGFANKERPCLADRLTPGCLMALAVVHHMAISNNLPLPMIAAWFHSLCRDLIVEFVPKTDSQVQLLLATRDDIFPDYTENGFEEAFSPFFEILDRRPVAQSSRILYRMKRREAKA